MTHIIHRIAAVTAAICIATFLISTITSELFGSYETVATVKQLIVMPGLFILVPAIAATGGTGFALAKTRKGKLIQAKKKRMPFVGANGLLVLIPCAIVLDRMASAGTFDITFYSIQAIELLAGAVNLTLMGMNIRDGLRMSGRFHVSMGTTH